MVYASYVDRAIPHLDSSMKMFVVVAHTCSITRKDSDIHYELDFSIHISLSAHLVLRVYHCINNVISH